VAKAEAIITITAPAEKIFNYINERTNLPEIWPSLVEIKDMEQLPDGGRSIRFVYKMAGVRLEGTGHDIENKPAQRIVTKTDGAVESTQTWLFKPTAEKTEVTFKVDYKIPVPVLGKLAEAVIVKINQHEGDAILANLKARMEN
jgi:uncharacterized membrane protein